MTTFSTNKLYDIFLHFVTYLHLANKIHKNHKLFNRKHSGGSDGLSKGGRPIETVSF